jgi:hypothetical protein
MAAGRLVKRVGVGISFFKNSDNVGGGKVKFEQHLR